MSKKLLLVLAILVSTTTFFLLLDHKFATIIISIGVVLLLLICLSFALKRDSNEFEKNMVIAIGFGVTVISWFVTGYINNANEIKRNKLISDEAVLQKKRDLKTRLLIDAFFKIQNLDRRDKESSADNYIYGKFSENAFAEIQLIGDSTLIKIASAYVLSNGQTNNNTLMLQLRNDLRKELGVSELPNSDTFNIVLFRYFSNSPVRDTLTSKDQTDLIIKLNQLNQELIR